MDTTKFLTGTLAGTVTSFIAGFLLYGLALKDYMSSNIMEGMHNDPPNFVWLVIGHIIFAALVTYIFLKWAGISTAIGGAKAGFILGLLFSAGMSAFFLGTSNFYAGGIPTALVDVLANSIIWAFGGLGVGWALGRGGS